jgi:DNA repair exonuclease SbcCD ATPase subunit
MLKKLLFVGAVLVVCGWAFGSHAGREAISYAKTGIKQIRVATEKSVPISFQIKRAEDLLENLDKTDDKLISALAGQIQAVRSMERDVSTIRANLERQKAELQARNDELKVTLTSSARDDLARTQLVLDLERRFKIYKSGEAMLKNKEAALENTKERLEVIKQQREELKAQRQELAARVEKLKTDLEYLVVAEAKNRKAHGDDQIADLSHLKSLVESIEKRIETTMIEHQLRQDGTPRSETKSAPKGKAGAASLADEIDAFFGKTAGTMAKEEGK